MDKKQITINMISNIVSYSANIFISFLLTPFLINTLGKETYSFYPIANSIIGYLSVLTNAMNSMASRFVTVSLVRGEKDNADKYFSSTLAANVIISCVLLIPISLIVIFLDEFMEVPINSEVAIKSLFALVFSSALINVAASVFGIATFSKNRIDLRSIRELVTAVFKVLLFLLLYKFLPPSIVYVGVVTLIIAVVNIIFQMVYTKLLLPEINLRIKNVSMSHTKELLGASCWNAINNLGNMLLAGLSMILANMFYGASNGGSYAIVNTVPQFISGIISMLVGVFYPVITYKYAQNDKKGLINEIIIAQSLIGVFSCSVISVFSAMASDFYMLWTPGENADFLSKLSFLTIIPHFFVACMWSLNNLNVVMNKVKIPALFTLVSGILNIVIAYVLYKLKNPGVVSLPVISSTLQIVWVGVFIPIYACKILKVKWSTFYPVLIKCLMCSCIVMICIIKIKSFFLLDTWLRFIIFGVCAGIITLLFFGIIILGPKKIPHMIETIRKKK